MSGCKVVSISRNELAKAESEKEDWLRKLLQNIESANDILRESGEPLLLGFIFQDLSMMTASMVSIANINLREKQSKSGKGKGRKNEN